MAINLPHIEDIAMAAALLKEEQLQSRIISSPRYRGLPVFLKMESELPFGSYKMRGVRSAIEHRLRNQLPISAIETISAGNMAQAVAACGRTMNIPVTAIVPETAPKIKTDHIEQLGATLVRKPMQDVWNLIEHPQAADDVLLIHPLITPGILAGYGAIALELLEQVPKCDAVYIPFGVGGLTLGVASVLRQLAPSVKIICVETAAAPTLTAARKNGASTLVGKAPTIADAIGTPRVVPFAFNILCELIDDTVVVEESDLANAMQRIYRRHGAVIEGAAAAAYAASLTSPFKNPVALITGKNIDPDKHQRLIN